MTWSTDLVVGIVWVALGFIAACAFYARVGETGYAPRGFWFMEYWTTWIIVSLSGLMGLIVVGLLTKGFKCGLRLPLRSGIEKRGKGMEYQFKVSDAAEVDIARIISDSNNAEVIVLGDEVALVRIDWIRQFHYEDRLTLGDEILGSESYGDPEIYVTNANHGRGVKFVASFSSTCPTHRLDRLGYRSIQIGNPTKFASQLRRIRDLKPRRAVKVTIL